MNLITREQLIAIEAEQLADFITLPKTQVF